MLLCWWRKYCTISESQVYILNGLGLVANNVQPPFVLVLLAALGRCTQTNCFLKACFIYCCRWKVLFYVLNNVVSIPKFTKYSSSNMLWYRRLEQVVRSGKLCFVGNGAKRSLLTNIGDAYHIWRYAPKSEKVYLTYDLVGNDTRKFRKVKHPKWA